VNEFQHPRRTTGMRDGPARKQLCKIEPPFTLRLSLCPFSTPLDETSIINKCL
jgi:hypothetical protein